MGLLLEIRKLIIKGLTKESKEEGEWKKWMEEEWMKFLNERRNAKKRVRKCFFLLTHTNTNTTCPYQHNIYTCAYTYKSNLILYMLVRFMFIRILFVSLLIDCIKKVSPRFSHLMYKWHTLYPFCGHLRKLKASLFHVVVADQTRKVREKIEYIKTIATIIS